MRILIIEDEVAGQELLKKNITENFPDFKLIGIVDNVSDAIKQITILKPDLVFLDIHIKGGTGFDVLSQITEKTFEVIFITAHNTYAIQALRAKALDYILKPISKNEFQAAVQLALKQINSNNRTLKPLHTLSVHTSSGAEFIKTETIIFLEADGAYTTIHTLSTRIVSTKNIGEYELLLPKAFFRCHHSFIINVNQIKKFEKGRSGLLIMNNDHKVPVSQRKMKDFSTRVI